MSVDGSKVNGIVMDDNHKDGLKSIVGSVHNAWLDDDKVMVDMAVSPEWKPTVKGLIDVKTALGGSIKGRALGRNKQGEIDRVQLFKAALTDTPAAWDLRGTASECTMCQQISKTIEEFDIEKSWDGSASRYTDEQYKAATLWCDPKVASGSMSAKSGCKLPVKDPDGTLNPAGVQAAWGAVNGARNMPNMPSAAIAAAKSKLKGMYNKLGLKGKGPLKSDDVKKSVDDDILIELTKSISEIDEDLQKGNIEDSIPVIEKKAKEIAELIKSVIDMEDE